MSNTQKRIIKTGDEQDAHTGWRRWYCYTQRAGVTKGIKRSTNRRERRELKEEMLREVDEYQSEL